jgi:RNA polymerase sigma-54 factor
VIGIEYQLESRMSLHASPALIAASEMLELPWHALEAVVQEALDQNPALVRLDAAECAVCQDRWPARCPACSPQGSPSRRPGDSGSAAVHPGPERPAPQTDADTLLAMVRMAVRPSDVAIAEYVIASLDDHGRLDAEPAEIAAALDTNESSVLRVLAAVRENGPPGVAATSAAECLLLQLDGLELVDEATKALACRVIGGHLPALARGHLASIASVLGVDQQCVAEVLRLIRERLRPYPAFEGGSPQPRACVVPDLIIRKRPEAPDELTVELVEPRRLRLGITPGFARRLEQPGLGDAGQLRGRLAEARQLLGQLRDRWETLRKVATYTVDRQRDFVREGPSGLLPLTRAEVAEALALHQSTVSRATAGKYAMLPSGRIVPLAAFYSASGGLAEELRRMVGDEDRPLSDEELAAELRARGHAIARRTVTKYRLKLGIPAAAQR